ncbi:tRNA (adenosine(37)-N6)-dimethylallyltransferase MiaA [Candidatus Nanosynbacter sp. TM7-057]|uniref:tRNA (adenosine(37)-N6)-dimethylallyltransferase MiaA n=1 Tax=Candidatus Nanosynbacter sp. TM7-057 TaxID=2902630 RepID=UPI001FB80F52|nr:tRNA (adenosine(37)-N6)-dimethylallyltransferase MiaA [Candidatus Nanosynbacter sp. TM7-057]MCJ1964666.1 tRNA (adenosine(37)-N6)-dimethylallyltransferase MiaA [Candidatus Nanosynbacter sp. TM7-057]
MDRFIELDNGVDEDRLPLIVIVGPTASGKTSLAIQLAKKYRGEIICADSRTVYRGMNVGTAKPSLEEQQKVSHWGLDLVDPGDSFSASQFKGYACQKIKEIRSRGNIPFLVGGTGLYIDSAIFDFQFGAKYSKEKRANLQEMTISELQQYCVNHDVALPENSKNKRYLIRAIERAGKKSSGLEVPLSNTIIVGITTDKQLLKQRITDRAKKMFKDGVVEETIELANSAGWCNEAMTGNVYPIIKKLIEKEIDEDQAVREFIVSDVNLVKRQLTWFRRNPFIEWGDVHSCEQYLSRVLDSK